MPYIYDIATAVPAHLISNEDVHSFYSGMLKSRNEISLLRRLSGIIGRTYIERRYSCLPDFNTSQHELFSHNNYEPDVGRRMAVYQEKAVPLSIKAVDTLLERSEMEASAITHIITVSCTGMMAPGLEFRLAEHYDLLQVEKTALNYLGCYAAIKAIREANYIALANPEACILVVCTELCSLHFNASCIMEELIANLLFTDGAAALLVMGDKAITPGDLAGFHIDETGTAAIPGTLDQMTWSITPTAFRMFLSRDISAHIRNHVETVIREFIQQDPSGIDCWAIHPGGIRIVQAVKEALKLPDEKIAPSLEILQLYGNMSSPTVLFILQKIFSRLRKQAGMARHKNIIACAFGPGLNIEMLRLSPVPVKHHLKNQIKHHAVQNTIL